MKVESSVPLLWLSTLHVLFLAGEGGGDFRGVLGEHGVLGRIERPITPPRISRPEDIEESRALIVGFANARIGNARASTPVDVGNLMVLGCVVIRFVI